MSQINCVKSGIGLVHRPASGINMGSKDPTSIPVPILYQSQYHVSTYLIPVKIQSSTQYHDQTDMKVFFKKPNNVPAWYEKKAPNPGPSWYAQKLIPEHVSPPSLLTSGTKKTCFMISLVMRWPIILEYYKNTVLENNSC